MKRKVIVVDDHLLIAKAISNMVNNMAHFEVLYEAENGSVLSEKFKTPINIPDIVLLDISMPIMNGFQTAEWLQKNYPDIKILVLSMQGDEESVIKMVRFGVKGYLHKNISPSELEKALTTLVNHGMYFPEWATSVVFNAMSKPLDNGLKKNDNISVRELEFLKYVATEMTYKEIADLMCCSPRTVEDYRNSLFEKWDIKTRVGLVMYAIKQGLIDVK